MDYPEIFNYRVNRDAPLPTGEPIDKLADEEQRTSTEISKEQ
jgi:hypothetical protein